MWAMMPKLRFFFSSRRRHTRCLSDWSSDVCSSDLGDSEACKKTENFGDFLLSDFARLGQVPAVTQGRSRPRHPRKPTPRSSRARSSSLERNLPFFISRPEFSQAFVRRRVNWSLGKLVQGNRSRRFRTTFRPPFRSSQL